MTEIINFLKKYTDGKKNTEKVEVSVLQLNRVIKALEQEPCEDCISRKEALASAKFIYKSNSEMKAFCMMKMLEEMPSIQPKPKTGHWVYKLEDWNKWTCSECGWSKRTDVHVKLGYSFCPNCGVKMLPTDAEKE